jgi:hypothetical protein
MQSICMPWVDRARLSGLITHRQDVVEFLIGKLIDGLRTVIRYVYPDFLHYLNGFGTDARGSRPGTGDFKRVTGVVSQQTFGHLASGGIAGAQDEDSLLIGHGR